MMPLHKENLKKKLTLLKLINQKKAILFGSLKNNVVTKKQKQEAWEEILRKAQSLGLATTNRDWCYTRDHIFGQWKSRTLAKYEFAKKIGIVEGREIVLNEVDKMILEIVQNDYQVTNGNEKLISTYDEVKFNSCSSLDIDDMKSNIPFSICIKKENVGEKFSSSSSLSSSTVSNENNLNFEPTIKTKTLLENDSIVSIKKQILESKLYKNKLQILKLERDLNLPSSKFSNEFQQFVPKKRIRLITN